MAQIADAFWRALAYCLHPRVILWSLLPLMLAGALVLGLGWFFWEDTLYSVRAALEQWALMSAVQGWLESVGAGALRSAVAPLIVVALAIPVLVVLSLLLVALTMTPALAGLVARRRFPALECRRGAGAGVQALAWSAGHAVLALTALVVTMPLWLVPPLALLLPAAVWGWLAARVLGFVVLALWAHASERRRIMQALHWPLLAMGLVVGVLGSIPSLLLALTGVPGMVFAPLLGVLAVWAFTGVFAFASLWFAHFLLSRLQLERAGAQALAAAPPPAVKTDPGWHAS